MRSRPKQARCPPPMSDEECVDDPLLCKIEEPSETTTPHIQSGTDIGEDKGSGIEVLSAVNSEDPELSVKVIVCLLSAS